MPPTNLLSISQASRYIIHYDMPKSFEGKRSNQPFIPKR